MKLVIGQLPGTCVVRFVYMNFLGYQVTVQGKGYNMRLYYVID
jgi:hypothetical protein